MSDIKTEESEIWTWVTIPVSIDSYDKLSRFCIDAGISGIPRRQNMCIEIFARQGVHPKYVSATQITFYMDELELYLAEDGDGNAILMLSGVCPPLEKMSYDEIAEIPDEENGSDEPLMAVILSNNMDRIETFDIENNQTLLRNYVDNKISFAEINTRYVTADNLIEDYLNGRDPAI